MAKYIKTGTTEFEQFNYEKWVYMRQDAYPMVFGDTAKDGGMMATNPLIKTLEGNMKIKDNDWIATGVNGEHWPVKDEIFQKTYKKLPKLTRPVSQYLEFCKAHWDLNNAFLNAEYLVSNKDGAVQLDYLSEHPEDFARAWLDGYEVE